MPNVLSLAYPQRFICDLCPQFSFILPNPPPRHREKQKQPHQKKQRTHPVKCWFSRTSSPHHSLKCKSLSFIKLHQLYSPKVWNYHKSKTTKTPAIRFPPKKSMFWNIRESANTTERSNFRSLAELRDSVRSGLSTEAAAARTSMGQSLPRVSLWLSVLKFGLTSRMCK